MNWDSQPHQDGNLPKGTPLPHQSTLYTFKCPCFVTGLSFYLVLSLWLWTSINTPRPGFLEDWHLFNEWSQELCFRKSCTFWADQHQRAGSGRTSTSGFFTKGNKDLLCHTKATLRLVFSFAISDWIVFKDVCLFSCWVHLRVHFPAFTFSLRAAIAISQNSAYQKPY